MDRMEAEDFSLFGLLGRSWQLDTPVINLTFDNSDGAVAFALADGSVAIARTKDSEPAAKRIRVSVEDGRSSILPRTKPLPPITRITVQDGTPVALTAYGKHGFVVGDASGALTSITIGGERTPFSKPVGAPITALAHASETGGLASATADHQVVLLRLGGKEQEVIALDQPAVQLAFSPKGDHLAAIAGEELVIWAIGEKASEIKRLSLPVKAVSLVWSPDQTRLAAGLESKGVSVWQLDGEATHTFGDYPAAVHALAWSPDSATLVTSGAFRVIAWPLNALKISGSRIESVTTGQVSLAAVEAVATHPTRPLIAAGYENGMLIIAQIGKSDELVIKTEGQGSIMSAQWSSDAGMMAVGSDRGLASIIELPPQLFK